MTTVMGGATTGGRSAAQKHRFFWKIKYIRIRRAH
jgi:hypothetical protein